MKAGSGHCLNRRRTNAVWQTVVLKVGSQDARGVPDRGSSNFSIRYQAAHGRLGDTGQLRHLGERVHLSMALEFWSVPTLEK